MKKTILILIVVGMFGFAVYDYTISNDETNVQESNDTNSGNKITSPSKDGKEEAEAIESEEVGLEKGKIAPDFELKTLTGKTVKLSDFRGEKVMLNFWATWCPPCRAEMPDMQKFHKNKDVKILAVNLLETESNLNEVQEFVNELGLTFSILLDEKSDVSNRYKISAYPSSFMIDSNGRIQFKAIGAMNYDLMMQEFEKME
ncbi:peroxiredoxin family protein [Virgibacillus sp. DJP39]|uniref:peroxiredoxin family protein n=1 Tax=Virgibacillus sp. DJP39 TaxID=3409790 RepID=UPI003BB4B10D